MGHEGKCSHLHGHNYVAIVEAEANELDGVGRVIDFAVLKERVGGWIEEWWDHGFIYNREDTATEALITMAANRYAHGQKAYSLGVNPTAENMADYLLRVVCPTVLMDTGVRVVKVTLWETENCFAEVRL